MFRERPSGAQRRLECCQSSRGSAEIFGEDGALMFFKQTLELGVLRQNR